jgi:hypothetical protein
MGFVNISKSRSGCGAVCFEAVRRYFAGERHAEPGHGGIKKLHAGIETADGVVLRAHAGANRRRRRERRWKTRRKRCEVCSFIMRNSKERVTESVSEPECRYGNADSIYGFRPKRGMLVMRLPVRGPEPREPDGSVRVDWPWSDWRGSRNDECASGRKAGRGARIDG